MAVKSRKERQDSDWLGVWISMCFASAKCWMFANTGWLPVSPSFVGWMTRTNHRRKSETAICKLEWQMTDMTSQIETQNTLDLYLVNSSQVTVEHLQAPPCLKGPLHAIQVEQLWPESKSQGTTNSKQAKSITKQTDKYWPRQYHITTS